MTTGGLLLALGTCLGSCTDPDTFVPFNEFGGPAGVITGTVTYSGPPPCTQGGEIVGAAVLLGFEEGLLPPPEGLGTTPTALSIVSGEKLFRGVRDQLAFDPGGKRVCQAGPPVVVSESFALGPVPAGVFQIRAFYDHDGDFQPTFSIFNLPTKGDIGGGAIDNAADALLGAPVDYRGIGIGELQSGDQRTMPAEGYLVEGVAVTLGLPIPFERPIFHIAEVLDEHFGNEDPASVTVPSDYQLNVFSEADPVTSEASFIRLRLGAGVALGEVPAAADNPFFLPTDNPILHHKRQDLNLDGVLDGEDHIPETALVPALLPLGLATRLQDGSDLSAQRPSVILQGVTLFNNLLSTVATPPDLAEDLEEVLLALRPAVLCIDPMDPTKDGVLVNTHPTDAAGNVLVPDPEALEAALAAQFGRPISIQYGCLPQGRYALNLIYDTGQAWTVPNETGICAESEDELGGGTVCGTRPRLPSQSTVFTIGEPTDPSYCAENPTPPACSPVQ